jgi:hypothetical protein
MSEHQHASHPSTTHDAIEEMERGTDRQTPASRAPGAPRSTDWSGVSSGAEGELPTGATPTSGSSGRNQARSGVDTVIDTAGQKASAMGEQASQKVDSLADQATAKADAGMEKAASGMDTLAGAIRDKSQSMGGGQMQSMATMAADKIESGADMLRQKDTDQLVSELEALVRRKPVESLLVAAGIGYLFAKAMR